MILLRNIACLSGMFMILSFFPLNASPRIEVDKTIYDCGSFTEGKDEIATVAFNIRNNGDSLLKITNVRPGCGCVVASFDTLIPPGKTGNVILEAKLYGYSGEFQKSAVVTSNATNEQQLRLTLKGKIQPVIAVSTQYISLVSSKDRKPSNLYLSSLKKDLKVTELKFKPHNQNSTTWSDQLSLPITFEWEKTDSVSSDGSTVFMLSIKGLELKEPVSGDFILSTNHPDKRQIQINGRIGNN